jgi:hypothetical protein
VAHDVNSQIVFAGTAEGKIVIWKYKYEKKKEASKIIKIGENEFSFAFRAISQHYMDARIHVLPLVCFSIFFSYYFSFSLFVNSKKLSK